MEQLHHAGFGVITVWPFAGTERIVEYACGFGRQDLLLRSKVVSLFVGFIERGTVMSESYTFRTTVVIATRNRCPELLHTLTKLTELHPRTPIVVVDNASTDGTAERIRACHPGVTFIALKRNLGAVARNVGAIRASTPYIAFSDDDSWWAPNALHRAEAVLNSYDQLGLIAAQTLIEPDQRPDPVTLLMAESPLRRNPDLPGQPVLGFLACSAITRREAFLSVGGFSSLLFFGGEESLLAWDLAARGWGLCYLPEVVAHHAPSPCRPSARRRRWQQQRNALLTTWMRRSPRAALSATASAVRAAFHTPEGWRALNAALGRLPAALEQRRRLPAAVEQQLELLESATRC